MKKLEDFKTDKIETKNIYGGGWVETTLPTTKDSNGCTVNGTDAYNDTNGNGKREATESYTVCVSTAC